ncbi:hypothetical protein JTE90_003551 [Oedothorax gibbosus]|uniref:Uncharacterized protein n=1 Tax=Oedothorax gibbosus TaxID=931172 RepID=A0AAV6VIV6_9ARAC|nr:hypothetical protein JTE90_003551 [Oedothorax gibbosus]
MIGETGKGHTKKDRDTRRKMAFSRKGLQRSEGVKREKWSFVIVGRGRPPRERGRLLVCPSADIERFYAISLFPPSRIDSNRMGGI